MTINQIEAFLTLAETLNYTKASMLLYTTQPNLSKMIFNLEQEVGAQLLSRSKRDVRLTAAGETFYTESEKMIRQYRHTLAKTRFVDAGMEGEIAVGFLGTASTKILPRLVNDFRLLNPKIQLKLTDYTYSPLVQALEDSQIDIAFVPDKELGSIRGISKKLIYSDDMCLVVSKDNKFAGADSVQIGMISKEPFVMMDPEISVRDVEMVSSICLEGDFTPNVIYEANTLHNLLLMVECNLGVSILARHMEHFATDNVRFINILGFENAFHMVCAWRENENPATSKFVELIKGGINN